MSQLEGYIKPGEENKICKLNKAIYGLKQAAITWNIKMGDSLKKLNFLQITIDPSLFKRPKEENILYIIVYVDNLLIAGKDRDINNVI